jgi:hypothetical protein
MYKLGLPVNDNTARQVMYKLGLPVNDNEAAGHAKEQTAWLLVRKRPISTERPPLVGEVSDNTFRLWVWRGQRNGSRPLILLF